jgi:energy-coupling factor transporter transmembrane protein EcfT
MAVSTLLQYRPGRSILHRAPALLKVALLFAASIGAFFLPPQVCALAIPLLFAAALLCGIHPKDALGDLRPALYYAWFLYVTAILAAWWVLPNRAAVTSGYYVPLSIFVPPLTTITVAVRLLVLLQLSSLLFRTTTLVALKSAIARICPPLAIPLALFLGFIPALFELWRRLDLSWRARGGKKSLKKLFALLPALISLAFFHADLKARALAARE